MYRRVTQTPSDTERMVPPEPEPEQSQEQHQEQIFAISNSAFDEDNDDSQASPKQPQLAPNPKPKHHHQPQQQILAIASIACDDKRADLENEQNAIVLWPTSDAAIFERYDKQHLMESDDC